MTPIEALHGWLVAFLALFLLANPLEVIPMFAELAEHQSPAERARLARRTGSLVPNQFRLMLTKCGGVGYELG